MEGRSPDSSWALRESLTESSSGDTGLGDSPKWSPCVLWRSLRLLKILIKNLSCSLMFGTHSVHKNEPGQMISVIEEVRMDDVG